MRIGKEPTVKKRDLSELSHVLRNKDLWPKNFEWNYNDCETCAMGLAALLWNEVNGTNTWAMEKAFDIDSDTSNAIFLELADHPDDFSKITPEHVANAIDEYLANKR